MPTSIRNIPNWIWATIVGFGTVIGLITGMLSVWNQIDQNIQESIETAAVLITTEIHGQTNVIAEFYEDDLYERIIMLETEVDELRAQNKPVPVQKIIHLKSMKERLGDFKER